MSKPSKLRKSICFTSLACLAGLLAGCTTTAPMTVTPTADYFWLNRLTWGANSSDFETLKHTGRVRFLQTQLNPAPSSLNPELQARIDRMTISQTSLPELVLHMEQRRLQAQALPDETARQAALQSLQQDTQGVLRETAARHYLRALYSPSQVQEQMVWFWLNHFNVFQGKANLRLMVGDYEENAIRPHALGKFRQLLGAAIAHPAMLRYLDNEQNAAGHLNENLARELLELHTLGVGGGYSQGDVQELARVLTGVGINLREPAVPRLRPELRGYYVRHGLFEFNPARHDFGTKVLLGQAIRQRGLPELEEVLDRLASHPATAAHVSHKLALFWLNDTPPPALEQRMAQTFLRSDGDIAATLEVLLNAPEFARAEPQKFKDPMRFTLSALRLAYDQTPILNIRPMLNWLNRMGQPLFGRISPDGYPLTGDAWSSSGQMAVRFEIAKAIGSGGAGLFQPDDPADKPRNAFPKMANAMYFQVIASTLGATTRQALDQAASPQEWNAFVLSAPEFMYR